MKKCLFIPVQLHMPSFAGVQLLPTVGPRMHPAFLGISAHAL